MTTKKEAVEAVKKEAVAKKNLEAKKGTKNMKEAEKKAVEKKEAVEAVAKKNLEDVKKTLESVNVEKKEIIEVKPAGVGIKVNNTRLCAVYVTRNNQYRIKSNKLALIDEFINEYSTSLECKLTSDKRDYEITGIDLDDDMLKSFIEDIAMRVDKSKEAKKAEKEAKAKKQEEEKAEKKAKKEAEKKAKEEAKAKEKEEKKKAKKEKEEKVA